MMGARSNGKWVMRYRWHGACAHNVDIEKLAGICRAQMAVESTVVWHWYLSDSCKVPLQIESKINLVTSFARPRLP